MILSDIPDMEDSRAKVAGGSASCDSMNNPHEGKHSQFIGLMTIGSTILGMATIVCFGEGKPVLGLLFGIVCVCLGRFCWKSATPDDSSVPGRSSRHLHKDSPSLGTPKVVADPRPVISRRDHQFGTSSSDKNSESLPDSSNSSSPNTTHADTPLPSSGTELDDKSDHTIRQGNARVALSIGALVVLAALIPIGCNYAEKFARAQAEQDVRSRKTLEMLKSAILESARAEILTSVDSEMGWFGPAWVWARGERNKKERVHAAMTAVNAFVEAQIQYGDLYVTIHEYGTPAWSKGSYVFGIIWRADPGRYVANFRMGTDGVTGLQAYECAFKRKVTEIATRAGKIDKPKLKQADWATNWALQTDKEFARQFDGAVRSEATIEKFENIRDDIDHWGFETTNGLRVLILDSSGRTGTSLPKPETIAARYWERPLIGFFVDANPKSVKPARIQFKGGALFSDISNACRGMQAGERRAILIPSALSGHWDWLGLSYPRGKDLIFFVSLDEGV